MTLIATLAIVGISVPYGRPAICYAAHAALETDSAHAVHGDAHTDRVGTAVRGLSGVHQCSGAMLCATVYGAPPTEGLLAPAVRATERQHLQSPRPLATPPVQIPDPPPPRA